MLFESINAIFKLNTMSQPKIKLLLANWIMRQHNSREITQFVSTKIKKENM
jgi:hypothetical protein